MAHHFVTSADIPVDGEHLDNPKVTKIKTYAGFGALGLGLISFVLLFVAGDTVRASYAYSWLFALFFFFTLCVGGCFWTLLHNVSNSSWGTSVRRVMENLGSVFPWMFLFAWPLLIPGMQHWLFEWMNHHSEVIKEAASHGEKVGYFDGKIFGIPTAGFYGSDSLKDALNSEGEKVLANKLWYMNKVAWYVRFIFYFVGLSLVIRFLRNLSTKQDTDPNPGTKNLLRARYHSTYTIIVLAITITFAGIDWLQGMRYEWYSTMWGVYLFAGAALNSMAVIVLTVTLLQRAGYMKKVVTPEHFHIKGKLMLAFTIFWAYVGFSQFFLIWYAGITEETSWYLIRNTEGWNTGSVVLVFGHFVVPFVILLQAWLKRNPKMLSIVAVYTLCMHVLDYYLIVIPERSISLMNLLPEAFPMKSLANPGGISTTIPNAFWGDILAFATIGCGFLFFYLRALGQHSLYPHRDPRILESANVSN
jgi:hypothetical protein